jgi:ribosomal protein L11 methyltransferase
VTNNNYYRLQLKNVPSDSQELITLWCFDHGAEGISEALNFRQNPQDYSVETLASASSDLDVFFSSPLNPEDLLELKSQFPGITAEIHREENRDWLAEWKKGFVPFELVEEVWVVPHWCEPPAQAKSVILMEPGMAFGTGTHETTKLAAILTAEAIRGHKVNRVFDVGTGTGILAVLAKRLGASLVEGNDIDPDAVRVANENLEMNKETSIKITARGLEEFREPYDLVIANIIDGVLVMLQKDLKRLVGPGGSLVLSGIIDERLETFRERFVMDGFRVVKHQRMNEWHGFWLQRT